MRFRLLGFPVHVHPMFWLVGLLLASGGRSAGNRVAHTVGWITVVFVSVLVHELGHALLMRRYGRRPAISLVGLGGETTWGDGPYVPPTRVALVSLAGPLAGFVLATPFAIAFALGLLPVKPDTFAHDMLMAVLFVNIGWGIINLLPILPLDGGRVMEVVAFSLFGPAGSRGARVISIALAGAAGVYGFSRGMPLLGLMAFFAVMRSVQELRAPAVDPAIPEHVTPEVDSATVDAMARAWRDIEGGDVANAIALCESRLEALPDEPKFHLARAYVLETLTWARLEHGDERAAIATRARMPHGFSASDLLDARLLLADGRIEDGLVALDLAYEEAPRDRSAIVVAAASIEHGRPERALALLRAKNASRLTAHTHSTIGAALFYAGLFDLALEAYELGWERFHAPTFAYNTACTLAQLGRVPDALEQLGRAIESGYTGDLRADPDLAPLRDDATFTTLASRALAR